MRDLSHSNITWFPALFLRVSTVSNCMAQTLKSLESECLAHASLAGVTPFASILADMVNKLESSVCHNCKEIQHSPAAAGTNVQKVYFRKSLHFTILYTFCS